MRHVITYLFSALLTIGFSYTAKAQQTKLLTADKHNEYGLVYTLPVTSLEIEVTATHTVSKAGPYYQYAKRYIGTDNIIKEDVETWVITDVKVRQKGIPDDSQQYLMQLKSGATTFICVAEDNMLLAINKQLQEVPQTRSLTSLAPSATFADKEYLQYVGEDFLASQSSAKQAQILAESLMEVRDAKLSLTRGTAEAMPTDGRQLELMLNSLASQEKALTSAFAGQTYSETVTRLYSFTPDNPGRTILFRMSDFAGFVSPDDYSGDPVYINVDITRKGELPVDDKGQEKKLPKDAVIYCIPGAAKIRISMGSNNLFEKEMEFAQYGVKFGLNPSIFTAKKEKSYTIFNAATGAIQEIGEVVE